MISLELKVFDEHGKSHLVNDWLVESDHPLPQMHVRHFCRACDLMAHYEAGTLTALECTRATGRCEIKREESDFGPQSRVKDYLPIELTAEQSIVQPKGRKPLEQPTRTPEPAGPDVGDGTDVYVSPAESTDIPF